MRSMVLVMVVVVGLLGCGSDSEPDPEDVAAWIAAPVDGRGQHTSSAECDIMLGVYCSIIAPCSSFGDQRTCLAAMAAAIDCRRAVGVTEAYPRCIRDLRLSSCATLRAAGALPPSCVGTIRIMP